MRQAGAGMNLSSKIVSDLSISIKKNVEIKTVLNARVHREIERRINSPCTRNHKTDETSEEKDIRSVSCLG